MNHKLIDRFIKESGIDEPMEVVVNCHWVASYEALTKFVELIVEECAQVCKTVGAERVSNADEKYQLGREMGAEVCHNTIKHHFGIE